MREIAVSDDFAEVIKNWEKYSDLSEAAALLSVTLQQKEKEAKIKNNIAEINKRLKELKELKCTFASRADEESITDDLVVLYDGCVDIGTLHLLQ